MVRFSVNPKTNHSVSVLAWFPSLLGSHLVTAVVGCYENLDLRPFLLHVRKSHQFFIFV